MSDSHVSQFSAGPLRITVEYRRTEEDEGPTVRVYGTLEGQRKQVLRFDCLVYDPHYHYDPDGTDEQHHMRDEGIEEPTEWTRRHWRSNSLPSTRR